MTRRIKTKADKKEDKKSGVLTVESFDTNEISLRPTDFNGYIGQEKVKEQVLTAVKSAMIREVQPEHILLYGPPGLGKTTMAYIVANVTQSELTEITGAMLQKPGDTAATLMSLKDRSILFIDEIHRMDKKAEEVLYQAMEDKKISFLVGQGEQQRNVTLDLPNFTLIGATTHVGMLSAPLRDRFGLVCKMSFYTPEELKEIIRATAEKFDMDICDDDLFAIAKASRGTPRVANMLTKSVRDYAVVNNNGIVDHLVVENALHLAGVNRNGLSDMQVKLLEELDSHDGPIGLTTISHILGEDEGTVEDVYEPYLLQEGYLEKTSRGRIIADKGRALLAETG